MFQRFRTWGGWVYSDVEMILGQYIQFHLDLLHWGTIYTSSTWIILFFSPFFELGKLAKKNQNSTDISHEPRCMKTMATNLRHQRALNVESVFNRHYQLATSSNWNQHLPSRCSRASRASTKRLERAIGTVIVAAAGFIERDWVRDTRVTPWPCRPAISEGETSSSDRASGYNRASASCPRKGGDWGRQRWSGRKDCGDKDDSDVELHCFVAAKTKKKWVSWGLYGRTMKVKRWC